MNSYNESHQIEVATWLYVRNLTRAKMDECSFNEAFIDGMGPENILYDALEEISRLEFI